MITRVDLLKQIEAFISRHTNGSRATIFELCDLTGLTLGVDTTWGDVFPHLCLFKGYAGVAVLIPDFGTPTNDGDTVYTETRVLLWKYDSGGAGGDTQTHATHIAMRDFNQTLGDSTNGVLWDLVELETPMDFTADGHILERRYRRVALNCEEV